MTPRKLGNFFSLPKRASFLHNFRMQILKASFFERRADQSRFNILHFRYLNPIILLLLRKDLDLTFEACLLKGKNNHDVTFYRATFWFRIKDYEV